MISFLRHYIPLVKGGGTVGNKQVARLLDTVRKRELEARSEQLLDVLALDVLGLLKLDHLENVDGSETRSVTSSHVLVKGLHSVSAGQLSELLVHVVGSGSRVVTEPDTEVLDLGRTLLVDLVDGHNLTVGLLNSSQTGQEVPEAGLGHHGVGGEDAHTVELRLRLLLAWEATTDHLVFVETTHYFRYIW